jgi:hypothetical protein
VLSLTSLTVTEFEALAPTFKYHLERVLRALHAKRQGSQTHNVKNNLLCNAQKQVLWLSGTYDGSVYDKRITDEQLLRLPAEQR